VDLKGRVALVTGASRGIGRAIALELASRGADVAVNYVENEDRNQGDALEVVRECTARGVRATAAEANVADFDRCQKMAEEVAARLGGVDILINNAGILRDRTMRKMTAEEWRDVLAVNLTGVFNASKAVVPSMVEKGWGRVVCMSSIIGIAGGFGQTNYAASKAGMIGFAKSLAREVASKGVTVNAVAPGLVDTEILADVPEEVMAGYLQLIPIGRLAKPEEVAKLIAFLSSDDAAYITGQVIEINGGWHM